MKDPDNRFITIGKIGSTYGVHGWLKINAYTEFGLSILDYSPWYLTSESDEIITQVAVEDGRVHGKGIIAKLKGLESPEAARLLTGKLIKVSRAQLPALDKNEYYWSDLIG